jgi:hypothetical protein
VKDRLAKPPAPKSLDNGVRQEQNHDYVEGLCCSTAHEAAVRRTDKKQSLSVRSESLVPMRTGSGEIAGRDAAVQDGPPG